MLGTLSNIPVLRSDWSLIKFVPNPSRSQLAFFLPSFSRGHKLGSLSLKVLFCFLLIFSANYHSKKMCFKSSFTPGFAHVSRCN